MSLACASLLFAPAYVLSTFTALVASSAAIYCFDRARVVFAVAHFAYPSDVVDAAMVLPASALSVAMMLQMLASVGLSLLWLVVAVLAGLDMLQLASLIVACREGISLLVTHQGVIACFGVALMSLLVSVPAAIVGLAKPGGGPKDMLTCGKMVGLIICIAYALLASLVMTAQYADLAQASGGLGGQALQSVSLGAEGGNEL